MPINNPPIHDDTIQSSWQLQVTEAVNLNEAALAQLGGTTQLLRRVAAPSASTSPGQEGDIASNATYFYYHTGTRWQRIAWDTTTW